MKGKRLGDESWRRGFAREECGHGSVGLGVWTWECGQRGVAMGMWAWKSGVSGRSGYGCTTDLGGRSVIDISSRKKKI